VPDGFEEYVPADRDAEAQQAWRPADPRGWYDCLLLRLPVPEMTAAGPLVDEEHQGPAAEAAEGEAHPVQAHSVAPPEQSGGFALPARDGPMTGPEAAMAAVGQRSPDRVERSVRRAPEPPADAVCPEWLVPPAELAQPGYPGQLRGLAAAKRGVLVPEDPPAPPEEQRAQQRPETQAAAEPER